MHLTAIFNPGDLPDHLASVHELDFSADLLENRVAGPWVRLGARTDRAVADARRVKDEILKQSVLLSPGDFEVAFPKLDSVGHVFSSLGRPDGSIRQDGRRKEYLYEPFHRFQIPFTDIVGEPLVFLREQVSNVGLFINPDLWMYLGLEERSLGSGIWWDPRRVVDVMVRRVIEGNLQTVDIRAEYLLKYLQARQMSLVFGHYRQLLLFSPTKSQIDAFETGELTIGSASQGSKALLQNWGLQRGTGRGADYLQRRLHLWFEVPPPAIDVEDPWTVEPTFDPCTFTLPTKAGPVAPARWRHSRRTEGKPYEGLTCDFMDLVYFRQEVLTKYQVTSGYELKDDGSVSCRDYWSLSRSTARLGNELLYTAIGDFAEGVPFEEWPHWLQYASEPPNQDTIAAALQELPIPEAVNALFSSLQRLNASFSEMAGSRGLALDTPLWLGSLDSLAGRQLKWVYPATSDDDEFLKRATLTSTLFLDGLQPAALREFLGAINIKLHQTFDKSPKPLGSRGLLQRVTLVALLMKAIHPRDSMLAKLARQAEGKDAGQIDPELQSELKTLFKQIKDEFAPLAFLYDLRVTGGLVHPPNRQAAGKAAVQLGLPKGNWHRTDYLGLLRLVAECFHRISAHFEATIDIRS
jgi:hypothetical protein